MCDWSKVPFSRFGLSVQAEPCLVKPVNTWQVDVGQYELCDEHARSLMEAMQDSPLRKDKGVKARTELETARDALAPLLDNAKLSAADEHAAVVETLKHLLAHLEGPG